MDQNEQTELLREMRDLLRVIAEPTLAKRDEARRASLLKIVGTGRTKAKAVFLMDGTRSQTMICEESGIDNGNLSRLVKDLRAKGLITSLEKQPKLVIAIPPNFFEDQENENG
jgi:hypothetical protein